jgi:hypothetical protein
MFDFSPEKICILLMDYNSVLTTTMVIVFLVVTHALLITYINNPEPFYAKEHLGAILLGNVGDGNMYGVFPTMYAFTVP